MTRLPPTLLTIWAPTARTHLGGGDDIDHLVIQTALCARSRAQYGIRALIVFDDLRFRHEALVI